LSYGNVEWLKLYDRNNIGGTMLSCFSFAQSKDSGLVISGSNGGIAILFKVNKQEKLHG